MVPLWLARTLTILLLAVACAHAGATLTPALGYAGAKTAYLAVLDAASTYCNAGGDEPTCVAMAGRANEAAAIVSFGDAAESVGDTLVAIDLLVTLTAAFDAQLAAAPR